MRNHLTEFMSQVFEDFTAGLADKESLCELRNLNLDASAAPDYSSRLVQQLYLLRYYPIHLAEYYLAYQQLLSSGEAPPHLNILSIGSGNGADYAALQLLSETRTNAPSFVYTGVDRAAWEYRSGQNADNCRYYQMDVLDWRGLEHFPYNVVFFCKSIWELGGATAIDSLLTTLQKSHIASDQLFLVSSNRGSHSAADRALLQQLSKALEEQHGYSCRAVSGKEPLKKCQSLSEVSSYLYPERMRSYLASLDEQCPKWRRCTSDNCDIANSPVLVSSAMDYQIMRLER